MKKSLKTNTNKCLSCGGNMVFDPDSQSLYCNSCMVKRLINSTPLLEKYNIDNANKLMGHTNKEWLNDSKSMQCPNCGSKILLNNFNTSTKCLYCGSNLVATNEDFEGLKPHSIIPFMFGKDKALALFKEKLKSKKFIPSKFKKTINADEIRSYYFPAFVFDADCITNYFGTLYEEYEVTDQDGNHTTKRRYFPIKGTQSTQHRNIAIEASDKLSQYELNGVKPYDFTQAKAYTNEYIYGFDVEQYSNSVLECDKQAEVIMTQEIRKAILSNYSYDGVSNLEMQKNFSNKKYNYCILPMYRFNYSYKKKTYTNVMNGQTGKLYGNYPKSWLKILLLVLGVVAFIAIPILLIVLSIS